MKTQQVSTGGLILRPDKKFLIVQRSAKEGFMPSYWELPGGGSEYGETPQAALKREIKEECGLDVAVRGALAAGQYFMGDIQRVEIVFLCTLSKVGDKVTLSEEHSRAEWVSHEEIPTYKIDPYMVNLIREAAADADYWVNKYFSRE